MARGGKCVKICRYLEKKFQSQHWANPRQVVLIILIIQFHEKIGLKQRNPNIE